MSQFYPPLILTTVLTPISTLLSEMTSSFASQEIPQVLLQLEGSLPRSQQPATVYPS
jgi:hypothetical protein